MNCEVKLKKILFKRISDASLPRIVEYRKLCWIRSMPILK